MNSDKKIIYILVALIISLSIILLIKINKTPKYDFQIYNKIYDEYQAIFGEKTDNSNIQENKNILENSNNQTTLEKATINNVEQNNIIGKIIIPKINIEYPIIKETTVEYLKIAPTKYCGPEINKVRKSSYSRS